MTRLRRAGDSGMAHSEVVNVEFGHPTAAEARQRLSTEIDVGRRKGVKVLKVIHGYGSSGRGGALRKSLRTMLRGQAEQGALGAVVPGEEWSIFDEPSRALLDRHPELRGDRDLEQGNAGITLVELTRSASARASDRRGSS